MARTVWLIFSIDSIPINWQKINYAHMQLAPLKRTHFLRELMKLHLYVNGTESPSTRLKISPLLNHPYVYKSKAYLHPPT